MNERLHEILDFWEDRAEQGKFLTPAELHAARPDWFVANADLVDALTSTMRRLRAFQRFVEHGEPALPRFPGYTTLGYLGSGGSADVFLALKDDLKRKVAIKLLRTKPAAFGTENYHRQQERFRTEALALGQLIHPNIVAVHTCELQGDQPYIVMEYLPHSLAEPEQQEKLRAQGARGVSRFMQKVAEAVAHAHKEGYLHRDLKPGNILLDSQGQPKVADFGLAKLLAEKSAPDSVAGESEVNQPLNSDTDPCQPSTKADRQPGTPPYMAPEQYDPTVGPITAATDIWSLGVILYELMHGEKPFTGPNKESLRNRILQTQPVRAQGRWPQRLDRIIGKCLQKQPAKRYSSAAVLASALQSGSRRTVWPLLVAASAMLILCLWLARIWLFAYLPQRTDLDLAIKTESLLNRLHRGETVQVIGAGIPTPAFSWRKGDGDLTPADDSTGAIRIAAQGPALLELLPEISISKYKIIAEISHEMAFSETAEVGVYSCYDMIETPQVTHHVFVKAVFADTGRLATAFNRPGKGRCSMASLSLFDFVRDFRPEKQPHDLRMLRGPEFFFFAKKPEERKWRRLEVHVHGVNSLTLFWDQGQNPQVAPHVAIQSFFADLRRFRPELQNRNVVLRCQGAIGIFVNGSSVLVKTLEIAPLE